MRLFVALACCMMLVAVVSVRGDERLAGKACRSVHLGYQVDKKAGGDTGIAFYNEVSVDQSAPGTYFCVCGWNKGYFGIQELADGKKLAIFSVWDSGQDDPKAVAEDKRVKLLHQGEKVRIGRFGGEGSGGQSFLDLDWKAGKTYRFMVTAKVDGERTIYAGYLRGQDDKDWTHMVTFSTITGGKKLGGYYAFVEDFKRDKASLTKQRKAHFGNAWVKTMDHHWLPVVKARFTADSNPATNIDAGTNGTQFFLATGGETKNDTTKLSELIAIKSDEKPTLPEGLPTGE